MSGKFLIKVIKAAVQDHYCFHLSIVPLHKFSRFMRRKVIVLVLSALICMCVIASCDHTPIIPEYPLVSFANDVQPIIIANCTQSGCHENGNNREIFPLLTYNDVMNSGRVSPGNARNSRLYLAIVGSGENAMPPGKLLTNDQITTIYVWIEQGAKNN